MAKIIDGLDYEDLDEEEQEMLEQEEEQPKMRRKLTSTPKPTPKPKPKMARFGAFQMPARIGIIDNETKEIVAEGEAGLFQVLASILERLERIEYKIGNILEE